MGYSKNRSNQPPVGDRKATVGAASRRSFRVRPVAIAAVIAILAVVAFLAVRWRTGNGERRTENRERKTRVAKIGKTPQKPSQASQKPQTKGSAKSPSSATSADAEPVRQMTPEEIEAEERRKDPLYDRHHIVAKMPLVKEPIEQLMLTVFTTELGDMPPMLPAIPPFDEARFEKIVNLDTLPEKGDSEEVRMSKELVNQVKAELTKYLKEGGTTSGFLAYYVNELDSAFHEREICKEMQMKSMKTDDPEVAREVYLKLNKRLADRGIKKLTLTKRQKEYLGIKEDQ